MNSSELLSDDQLEAIEFLYQNDQNYLIAKMGAGKSVIALSAIVGLLAAELNTRFLIFAPKKVCASVWAHEHKEWEDLSHLRVGVITENEIERQRIFSNIEDYDVICCNYEMMPWMTAGDRLKCFDGLLIDEGSKIGAGGRYFKLLRRFLKQFKWRTVMTGTPVSENHVKLFYQMFAVGDGMIFGRNKQTWLDKFFYATDYNRRKWELRPDKADEFIKRIAPYTHVVPDYSHVLPPLGIQPIFIDLPKRARESYVSMARKMKAEGVEAISIAVKMTKLQQICSGALYSEKEVIDLHTEKMKWVKKITQDESRNHLIIYQYDFEAERLQEAYPDLVIMPSASAAVDETVAAWNHDEIRLLAIHSRSAGHGLNLQEGGHSVIWMSPVWSNDAFEQVNARLHRRGQKFPVTVCLLLMKDTIEDLVIVPRLESKQEIMPAFLAHLESIEAGEREEPARPRKAYPH
jgi:hypothetical protein